MSEQVDFCPAVEMTGIAFDPSDAAFRTDPYPTYQVMLEHSPVYYFEPWSRWYFFAFEDCLELLHDRRLGHAPAETRRATRASTPLPKRYLALADYNDLMMLVRNEPDHARLRRLVSKAFASRAVARIKASVDRIVNQLLDAADKRGRFDLVGDFASPLAISVIREIIGLPVHREGELIDWSNRVAAVFDATATPADWERALAAFDAYQLHISTVIRQRPDTPRGDLISSLLPVTEGDAGLSMDELLANVMLLLIGGYETTVGLISTGVLLLCRHSDQALILRDEPGLISNAIEEMIRYCSPISGAVRAVLEPFEYHGIRLERAQSVHCVLAAANRDPRRFSNPNAFDVRRPISRNLGFGTGIHSCLGASLARTEAAIAISALLHRYPNLRLAEPSPKFVESYAIRRLKSLSMEI